MSKEEKNPSSTQYCSIVQVKEVGLKQCLDGHCAKCPEPFYRKGSVECYAAHVLLSGFVARLPAIIDG